MTIQKQIKDYIATQPEAKQKDMQALHTLTVKLLPTVKLWFFDGRDENNKVVANPTIGYGTQTLQYANGTTRQWFRIGISGNTTGISVYILGIKDKAYLKNTFGSRLGKASVTGYCIKFKALKDINAEVLKEAILFGLQQDL